MSKLKDYLIKEYNVNKETYDFIDEFSDIVNNDAKIIALATKARDVDSHRFKLEKNNEFIYRLVSLLLIKEKEYNPEMYVSQLHPDTQELIVDMGNMLYEHENEKL